MKCVVIGAGVAGLTAAWEVQKIPGMEVIVLEASSRAGGWVQTEKKEGFLFERGARSLRPQPDTMGLLEELHLTSSIVWGSKEAHQRYVWYKKKLRSLPHGLFDLLASPWIWPVIPEVLRDLFRSSQKKVEGESIDALVRRRLGPFTADVLLDAMVRGIYAGDPRELLAEATFPSLAYCETSLIRKAFSHTRSSYPASLFTLKGGLETLPQTLASRLNIQYGVQVKNIEEIKADYIVVAAPLDFLPKEKRESVAVVSFGYQKKVLPKEGFGYLIPRREGERIFGVVFDSSAFPSCHQEGTTTLTVMLPPSYGNEQEIALEALDRHLGIQELPAVRSSFVANRAIPQYTIEHALTLKEIEKKLPTSIYLTGASFTGVALNDSISFAKKIRTSIESKMKA